MRPLQFITVIIKPAARFRRAGLLATALLIHCTSDDDRRMCVCVCRSLRANRQHTERLGANRPVHGPRHARRTLRQLGRCRAG